MIIHILSLVQGPPCKHVLCESSISNITLALAVHFLVSCTKYHSIYQVGFCNKIYFFILFFHSLNKKIWVNLMPCPGDAQDAYCLMMNLTIIGCFLHEQNMNYLNNPRRLSLFCRKVKLSLREVKT